MERDVSRDPAAAREAMSRSGQTGVPVTVSGSDVIVGFDRARLDALARNWKADGSTPPMLGVSARDAAGGGAEVGRVNPGQPAERAGVRPGDVIVSVNGVAVRGVDELLRSVDGLTPGSSYPLEILRGDQRLRVLVQT